MTPRSFALDALADRGMWISDDRVYAFVGVHGIHTVGWHGAQPVSRNSRMLDAAGGAITVEHVTIEHSTPIVFTRLEWTPAMATAHAVINGHDVALQVRTAGRALHVTFEAHEEDGPLRVRIHHAALVTNVQGTRTWEVVLHDAEATLRAHDVIMLQEWMRRTGPYAGDFLISEHVRRRIFVRPSRSGDATPDDLRAEFRTGDLALYDALSELHLSTPIGSMHRDREARDILVHAAQSGSLEITLACSGRNRISGQDASPATTVDVPSPPQGAVPADLHRSHPHLAAWMADVPALVDSCIVRDLGVPRACPGAYYWIWAWDAMVSAHAALAWGRTGTAEATARFITTHRDADGRIPMRWTRALEPLDVPERGALETLHLLLVRDLVRATGDDAVLAVSWPAYRRHVEEIARTCDARGRFPSFGFYPDLPRAMGRSEHTAVALEVGMFGVFCAVLAPLATERGDETLARQCEDIADRIRASFVGSFLDEETGLLADAVDLRTGRRTGTHPLFSLMVLRAPEGWTLIDGHVDALADAIASRHLSADGFRTMPADDVHARSESVSNAWYPHWDRYAVALLARAGRHADIAMWLDTVERTLAHLGYCPEFLTMDGFDADDRASWLRHGAASNLTGVTAWYEAVTDITKETTA